MSNMDGQGPQALSTETCRCCAGTMSWCLESVCQWASVSITQAPTGCPAAFLSCEARIIE